MWKKPFCAVDVCAVPWLWSSRTREMRSPCEVSWQSKQRLFQPGRAQDVAWICCHPSARGQGPLRPVVSGGFHPAACQVRGQFILLHLCPAASVLFSTSKHAPRPCFFSKARRFGIVLAHP